MRIRQWSAGILAVAVVAAIVIVASYSQFGFSKHGSKEKSDDQDELINLSSSETAFNLILAKSDVDELFVLSNELADEGNQQLAVRLDRLAKRLKIVDRILASSLGPTERDRAILSRLNVLMEWETLSQANNFSTSERTANLRAFANEHLMGNALPVKNRARTALALAAISEFLDAPPGEKNTALVDEALQQFQSAIEANRENSEVAKIMLDWLQILHDKTGVEQTSRFSQAFDAFDSSPVGEVKDLVSVARKRHSRTDILLDDFLSSNSRARDEAIARFMQDVETSLDAASVSESLLLFVLERAQDLLVFARTEEAQQIHDRVKGLADSVESSQLPDRLIDFNKRIALFGRPLDLSNIDSREDQPASINLKEAKFRILFFVSSRNRQESVSQFMTLLKSLRRQLAGSRVELALVFVEYGNDRKVLDNLKEFADQSKHWQLWKLSPATDSGKEFLSSFPINATPYAVVLDQSNQVVSLGPPLQFIEEIVVRKK